MSATRSIAQAAASRQILIRDNPGLLDWSRHQWRAWVRREQGRVSRGRRVVVAASLTCIDDLYVHVGLLQLLGLSELSCSVVLTLPSEAMARIVRAQARREEWHGLVQIISAEHLLPWARDLSADIPLAMFHVPTFLQRDELTSLSDGRAFAKAGCGVFLGPSSKFEDWSATADPHSSFKPALWRLRTLEWMQLPSNDEPAVEAVPAVAQSRFAAESVRPALGRLELPDIDPDDEVVVSRLGGGGATVIARSWGALREPHQALRVRLPSSMLTTEPQQVRVETQEQALVTTLSVHVPPGRIKPWMLSAFLNRGGGGNPVIKAFASSIGCRIAYAEDEPEILREIPIVWGVLRGSDRIIAQAKAQNLYYFYIDHAYFNRGHGKTYRIARNAYDAGLIRDCPGDRISDLAVEVDPWRKGGREIIVCPPTEYFMEAHGCPDWLEMTLASLRAITDRPIHVRLKPQPGEAVVPLPEALRTAHALVTHSSNVAIEAACLGTPVFVSPASAAAPIGRTDLAAIEEPAYPDRAPWLAHLAYNQFSFDEIGDGRAWRMLLELEERAFV